MKKYWIKDYVDTEAGKIPVVSPELELKDKLGTLKVRFSVGRMKYTVDPGLYALGKPNGDSRIFVSANYKLSFDTLRKELKGLNCWILVLDTKGINVWCAAGKGTFGTKELVSRIESSGLGKLVNHREIIVPQLGATGVSAHEVKKLSGFRVLYGPVRTKDIPEFMSVGLRTTPEMREVRFSFIDRLVLVPVELVGGAKYLLLAIVLFILLAGLNIKKYPEDIILAMCSRTVVNLSLAYIVGTVIGPLLLPWLPGRGFSIKGGILGIVVSIIMYYAGLLGTSAGEIIAWLLVIPALSSFILMNFTGSTTYTSISGVKKEMKAALPVQAICVIGSIILMGISRFN